MKKILQFPTDEVRAKQFLDKLLEETLYHLSPGERKDFAEKILQMRARYRLPDIPITLQGLTPAQCEAVSSAIKKDLMPVIRRIVDDATTEIAKLMLNDLLRERPLPV